MGQHTVALRGNPHGIRVYHITIDMRVDTFHITTYADDILLVEYARAGRLY